MTKKDTIIPAAGPEDGQLSPVAEQLKDYAIFMLTPRGDVSSWNTDAERIHGYSATEIIGQYFSVFYTEEDVKSGVPQKELEVARLVGSLELEGWRQGKDGSRFRALVTISSQHDTPGVFVGFGIMIRLVTERCLAEEALPTSHTMFERLFELAPEAVVVVDNHGVIRQVNQQAEVLFGYQREEMLGNRIELLMPLRFREGHQQQSRGYFKTPGVRNMGSGVELFGLHRDGREIPVDIMLNPIESSEGAWAFAVIRDITQQKQNIALITELNASLKIRVENLSDSNQELESYSYSISHDLRAPLRHIIGFVDLLKEQDQTALDDTSRHYLQVISRAAQKMGKLIDGLLAFSQLGRTDLRKVKIDFDKLVRETAQKLTEDAKERKIEWEIAPLPTVVGDPALLHRAMANLLENALKFTKPRAQAKIEIGALDEPNGTLFYVRDNGVGFNPRYVSKLFGMFQRLHSEEEFEGVGVGLAHVQAHYSAARRQGLGRRRNRKGRHNMVFPAQSRAWAPMERVVFALSGQGQEGSMGKDGNHNDRKLLLERQVLQYQQREIELRKLASAVEHSPISVMITDPTGLIEYVNPKFCQVTGYSLQEVTGKNPRFLKGDVQPKEFYRDLWETILAKLEWHGQFHNRNKDGSLVWELASISPVCDEYGAITHFVGVKENIEEFKRLQAELGQMAHFDKLTGLPNRALLFDRLEQVMIQARRNRGRFALLFLDLDGFKTINDRFGHQAGDEILRAAARRLVYGVRESDTVARLGGDEFIVILHNLGHWEEPGVVARNLLEAFSAPFSVGEIACSIGVSIGISIYPDDAEDTQKLISCADSAMYEVKRAGKNEFRYSTREGSCGKTGK